MSIYIKQKIIYIHIPKTGGTSIKTYLNKKYGDDNKKKILGSCPLKDHYREHFYYHDVAEKMKDLKMNINKYKIFAVIRHPYDRVVSEMAYRKLIDLGKHNVSYPIGLRNKINYNVKRLLTAPKNPEDIHLKNQYTFVSDIDGKLQKNIHILIQENLNNHMCRLGFTDFNQVKNRKNKQKINYKRYLSSESKTLIYNYFKRDFILFGFRQ